MSLNRSYAAPDRAAGDGDYSLLCSPPPSLSPLGVDTSYAGTAPRALALLTRTWAGASAVRHVEATGLRGGSRTRRLFIFKTGVNGNWTDAPDGVNSWHGCALPGELAKAHVGYLQRVPLQALQVPCALNRGVNKCDLRHD